MHDLNRPGFEAQSQRQADASAYLQIVQLLLNGQARLGRHTRHFGEGVIRAPNGDQRVSGKLHNVAAGLGDQGDEPPEVGV